MPHYPTVSFPMGVSTGEFNFCGPQRMFLRAWKHKKLSDVVLAQVQPFLVDIARLLGRIPAGFATDKFVLGFFCINIAIAQQQISKKQLSAADKGIVIFLVLRALFGVDAINEKEIGDLLNGIPERNKEFTEGCAAAYKVQAVSAGFPEIRNDPDVVAARDVVKRAGTSMDFISPDASESTKIGGKLLRGLFYERVINKFGKK